MSDEEENITVTDDLQLILKLNYFIAFARQVSDLNKDAKPNIKRKLLAFILE